MGQLTHYVIMTFDPIHRPRDLVVIAYYVVGLSFDAVFISLPDVTLSDNSVSLLICDDILRKSQTDYSAENQLSNK